ncbi:MAG: hypothetical protein WD312_01885 [Candidatus Paceibacterota bacterium]
MFSKLIFLKDKLFLKIRNKKDVRLYTFKSKLLLYGKRNFKQYFTIARDGTVTERILLNVPDVSLREEIICKHYLSFLVKNLIKEPIGINLLKRDQPWDFSVELSNGDKFNIEITSIAENKELFEKLKREEEFEKIVARKNILLRELKKIHFWFRNKKAKQTINDAEENFLNKNDKVLNPFYNYPSRIFYSSYIKNEGDSLKDLISGAIKRKVSKSHLDKDKTILIIDNRTIQFGLEDIFWVIKELEVECAHIPFPEIYFYTGHYSDDDGNNARYSFVPLK